MPLFNKKTLDVITMPEVHRKVLRRCRMVLIKDLDVTQILDHMSTDDGFRQDQRDSIMAFPTKEQRVGIFLDRLETRGEKTFALFMDALKEYYRPLHSLMEETARTIDDANSAQNRERVAISGEMVRKLLKSNIRQRRLDASQGSDSGGDESVEGFLDDHEESQYIDCYSIPTKGHMQKERWIKHLGVQKSRSLQNKPQEQTYMAVVLDDLVLKRVEVGSLQSLSGLKLAPAGCQVFVYDRLGKYVPPSEVGNNKPRISNKDTIDAKLREFGSLDKQRNSEVRENDLPPPPVPPKPENLPSLGISSGPPLVKPRQVIDGAEIRPPPRTTSRVVLSVNGDRSLVKPPVPKKKPIVKMSQSQSVQSAMTVKESVAMSSSMASLSSSSTLTGSAVVVPESCLDGISENEKQIPALDDDVSSLNYNVSACSTVDGGYDVEQRVESRIGREDSYEEVTPKSDQAQDQKLSYSSVDVDKKLNNHTTPSEITADRDTEDVFLSDLQSRGIEDVANSFSPVENSTTVNGSITNGSHIDGEQLPTTSESSSKTVDNTEQDHALHADSRVDIDADLDVDVLSDSELNQQIGVDEFDLQLPRSHRHDSSTDDSYYEEIETLNGRHSPSNLSYNAYLDPCPGYSRQRGSSRMSSRRTRDDSNSSGLKYIPKNTFVIADVELSCSTALELCRGTDASGGPADAALDPDPLEKYRGTRLVFDKEGNAFYIPNHLLKKHGEPDGEPWFYPLNITSRQATLFLSSEKLEGCFVIYRPLVSANCVVYNLSVCLRNGDVVHYHIVENVHGDLMIEGHDHSFIDIHELVDYFCRNKSSLATRLRRPLKYARLPITPGCHYDLKYELPRDEIFLTGKIIGKGNFGVVCEGVYKNLPVAVKVLQRTDVSVFEEDEFIEEARSMMGLKHEQIVQLVGVSCKSRPLFIVTEYINKGSLKDCLRNGTLSSDDIDTLFDVCIQVEGPHHILADPTKREHCNCMIEVLSAMNYLEGLQYMLHRDLAARNFLVGDDMCIKLADFGRARHVVDDYYQAPRTEKICIKWASPEVLVDSRYSTKSDVWAAGIVFWEIFSTGERPYASLSGEQTAVYVTEGGRLDKPPRCPPDLYSMMKKCWRDDPDERPSFSQLYDKLKSKSSIYYCCPVRPLNQNRNSNNLDAAKQMSPAPGKGKTPTSTKSTGSNAAVIRQKFSNSRYAQRDVSDSYGNGLDYYIDHNIPTSSSETSIISISGLIDGDKDDLTRGDKIRKSLRKLMKMKSTKRKPNSKTELRRSTKSVPAVQLYSTT